MTITTRKATINISFNPVIVRLDLLHLCSNSLDYYTRRCYRQWVIIKQPWATREYWKRTMKLPDADPKFGLWISVLGWRVSIYRWRVSQFRSQVSQRWILSQRCRISTLVENLTTGNGSALLSSSDSQAYE